MAINPNDVAAKSPQYIETEPLWTLPDDLLGGTLRMRSKATTYLPQKEAEETQDYSARVCASFLFNGYKKALDDTTAKPFERPVTVQAADDLDEFLAAIEDNVDRSGRNLTAFGRELMHEGLHRGVTHVLVDFPRVEDNATLADRRDTNARPVFIHVQPPRLIGWRTEFLEDGTEILSMVRIWEEAPEPDGAYGQTQVQRVRVYTRDKWEIHTRTSEERPAFADVTTSGPPVNQGPARDDFFATSSNGEFKLTASGAHSFGEVPLVTLYFERTGYLTGRPVFEDVAHTNLAHYQSSSRQRAYLDFARIGTIALLGFTKEDLTDGMVWGANRFIRSSKGPQEAAIEPVEHQGHAIAAGRDDLSDLKEEMQVLATAPLVQRATAITATGEARDEDRGMSKAQAWVRDLEQALERCYQFAAQWLGADLPEDFAIDVFSDFGVTQRGAEEAKLLLDTCLAGKITATTLLREWKRRGIFADSFDVDEELDRLEEEGPDMVDDPDLPQPPGDAEDEDAEDDGNAAQEGEEVTAETTPDAEDE